MAKGTSGMWSKGFSRAFGVTTSPQPKLRALKNGLSMTLEMGISRFEIELDSLTIIELIESSKINNDFFLDPLWISVGA